MRRTSILPCVFAGVFLTLASAVCARDCEIERACLRYAQGGKTAGSGVYCHP
jgi:hypothetical protein